MNTTLRAPLRVLAGALAAWLLGACAGSLEEAHVRALQEPPQRASHEEGWEEGWEEVRARRSAMGTWFEVRLWHRTGDKVEAALEAVWSELERVEQALSDYRPDSEVRGLEDGEWHVPSPVLAEALAWSEQLVAETTGACDPTVGPLTRLWRRAARQAQIPDGARLAAARAAVGWAGLERSPDGQVRLRRPGMRLDFGAFGKGLALDRAYAALCAAGLQRALIDGGGDLRIGQAPPGHAGWQVVVSAAEGDRQVLQLSSCGLATSGLSARPLTLEGRVMGHILDPRTGEWLDRPRAASCIAPTATQADGWATALCITGAWVLGSLPGGVEGRLLEPVGDAFGIEVSPGFLAAAPAITDP
ncbi:MAG: FAD:protein FMN transferase [Planctomycetes bacterium]|nr:FAD:protein FMN transferase [Planctomycetota bacterium]